MADLMDDSQLLAEFVKTRSSDAFGTIVRRHVDLVYGTARRLVDDEHLAQDVAQAAFLVLVRKAKNVEGRRLPGWLVNATRLAAREARRSRLCREKHEGRAAQMRSSIANSDDEPTLEQLTPLLDEALSLLSEMDRTVVVIRFLQGKSFAEVGAAMGTSEEAARKRVQRAVEKLRAAFMKRGIAPSIGGLMVVLAASQAQAAPAGLAGTISAGAASGGVGTSALLAKGVIKVLTWANVKVAMVVAMLAAGSTAAIATHAGVSAPVATTVLTTADSLADPSEPLIRPAWPAKGSPELMQVSCVVDAKVAEKLRRAGKPVQHQCTGYEAMRIDPDLVLYFLKAAKQADLAYLPDDMWHRWNTPLLIPKDRRLETVFEYGNAPGRWRGERFQLAIRQQLASPIVYERRFDAGELTIDQPNVQITLNGQTRACDLKLQVPLAVGEGVMLLGKVGQMKAGEIWHVILYQGISATPQELANYSEMRDVVSWIENGAAIEQRMVQQAVLWQNKARRSGMKLGEKWTRNLPGGIRIEVLGIANPSELNPYCWWTPDGAPTIPGYHRESLLYSEKDVVAVAWVRISQPDGFFSRKSRDHWTYLRAGAALEEKAGAGAFHVGAKLKPEVGQRVLVDGQPYAVTKFSGSGSSCSVEMEYTIFRDQDTRVVALTEDGKEHDPFDTDPHNGETTVTDPRYTVGFPVAKERVKELRVKVRPLSRVRFEDMALMPTEALPEPGSQR